MEKAIQEAPATQEAPAEEPKKAISHEDLSAAWDKEMKAESVKGEPEEEKAEEKAEGVVPPEPEKEAEEPKPEEPEGEEEELSHGEKSRLGRKIKKLLDSDKAKDATIKELTTMIASLKGSIETLTTLGTQKAEEPQDPDALVTVKDLNKILNRQREEMAQESKAKDKEREAYETTYVNEMLTVFEADDVDDLKELSGFQADLYSLLTGNTEFNQVRTGNPKWDFQLNKQAAELHLLKTKPEAKKPKLKQEEAKGTGVGGESKEPAKVDKSVDVGKLDAKSREFLADVQRRGGDTNALLKRTFGE